MVLLLNDDTLGIVSEKNIFAANSRQFRINGELTAVFRVFLAR